MCGGTREVHQCEDLIRESAAGKVPHQLGLSSKGFITPTIHPEPISGSS